MSVEAAIENGSQTGGGDQQVYNGMSNGHQSSESKHKSSSKDKHRDKDREHKSSSSHKKSSRDKDKHSSKSSSSKDKHRDKDREGKHHSSSKSSSSSAHHDNKDKEKSDRDKDKHKSSSSSSGHHHKSSSSKDKERSKDRKESGSSSSSHKSSSHDKDRDKNRHHKSSSSGSSSHKHSSSRSKSSSSHKHEKTEDGFIKPVPLSPPAVRNIPPPNNFSNGYINNGIGMTSHGANGLNHSNGARNGYNEEDQNVVKQELSNQYFDVSQASSCDYSMSQFKEDEPNFVCKEEASLEDDDDEMSSNDNGVNQTQTMEEENDDYEEDVPLAQRLNAVVKQEVKEEEMELDEEDIPLLARAQIKKEKDKKKDKKAKKLKRIKDEEEDYEDEKPQKKKTKKQTETKVKQETVSPTKRKKKEEEEVEVWRWWEEEKREDGVKWTTLEHKGPVFAPPYERLPKNVRFYYDGKPYELSSETEEAATFYAKMLNHDYCTKDVFNKNFFGDFRKTMNSKEREIIKDFKKCNFQEMHKFFEAESEKRKNSTKEEKERRKQENEQLIKEYGFCMIDGHKEKIGNFRLEPPGLFRGRGEHPKMGMIKRRIRAEDISINCGKEAKIPPPPSGSKWKEVRHDNTVTWLASWTENVQGQVKYIMLNPSSKLKGEKDHVKYETARKLDKCIDKIRNTYREEWKSKEMRVRQRAVALYFIDKLALRAGNEKDEDQADTVGCCSLRYEHVQLHKELNGKENVVVFDFLGKDSIRYYNEVEVEKRVFKNLELFRENKKEGDDLFDRLNTQVLNEHLKELMDGLTAKVFRTYNASITLQNQLDLLTKEEMSPEEKILAYNRANRAVAVLCNHQRAVPKSHQKSMDNLKEKIRAKREQIENTESELYDLRRAAKRGSVKEKINADKKEKQLARLQQQLRKLECQETDRDENKTIALGTSKLNYLDPRISVAWCKKHNVPIEKIYNKTQRTKFLWAIHMADENYRF